VHSHSFEQRFDKMYVENFSFVGPAPQYTRASFQTTYLYALHFQCIDCSMRMGQHFVLAYFRVRFGLCVARAL
jgi:hypothetical protein